MFNAHEIIIDRPEVLGKKVVVRDSIITTVFWFVLVYIFRPAVAIILWFIFGTWLFAPNVFNDSFLEMAKNFVFEKGPIILIMGMLLIIWAMYNKYRFGRLNRRHALPTVEEKEDADLFKVDIEELKEWKKASRIEFDHDQLIKFKNMQAIKDLESYKATSKDNT